MRSAKDLRQLWLDGLRPRRAHRPFERMPTEAQESWTRFAAALEPRRDILVPAMDIQFRTTPVQRSDTYVELMARGFCTAADYTKIQDSLHARTLHLVSVVDQEKVRADLAALDAERAALLALLGP